MGDGPCRATGATDPCPSALWRAPHTFTAPVPPRAVPSFWEISAMSAAAAAPAIVAPDVHQRAFVALLPRIEARARATFRRLRCPHDRDDAVAEVVARAWERFR